MESTRPKSVKPTELTTGSEDAFVQKADEAGIRGLVHMKEIHWQPGNAFATVVGEEDISTPVRLPIHAVYQAFGKGEGQLRKIVDLLLTGGGQRVEAVVDISNAEQAHTSVAVTATLNQPESGSPVIVLDFSTQCEPQLPWRYPLPKTIPSGFLVVEAQVGSIIKANPEALTLLGIADDELANIPWQRTPEWLQFIREVVEQGSVTNRVLEILPDKTWLLFSAQYTKDNIYVVAQDVSAIQQQIKTLEQVNTGLDNFVYHASHDLRAPLRSMQGLITLLQNETNDAERNRFVGLIEGSIKRLDAFLVNLLSISRSRSSVPRPLLKINFMVEVEQSISSFFHLEDHKNLEISTRISQPNPFVSDLTQIRVILNNIISNAFKYRRYGIRKSRIKVEVRVSKKQANIKIWDNGIGLDEEHLPHVFDMFYRATDRSEGSGLGLFIVHETVERLKGNITITSRPNRGTTLTVILPNQFQRTSFSI
ncbi:sensor histidine kinase [Tunicatimonas pelagia]|uniref:sensor histidine kinase n=1 Tax=Tunicatimonas pelagia TaxID=931531 RepID=UPI00266542B1|nr:HAMP domain-containing sensor histidine kinase [Tunicatimonas pelagia]WKN44436.1 HAMP domain-containing sensor histidine kinase [Tunicatimonas pelagia]